MMFHECWDWKATDKEVRLLSDLDQYFCNIALSFIFIRCLIVYATYLLT